MPAPVNTYNPDMSGGDAVVPASGTLVVDTGLPVLGYAVVALAQDSVATAAGVSWSRVPRVAGDATAKITIKTWAADGIAAGSSAAAVSWAAFASIRP